MGKNEDTRTLEELEKSLELTDEMINTEYGRWLYTALTRATKKLYLLNFKPDFFG